MPTELPTRSAAGLASLTLHNLAITVSDLDSVIAWYGRVLGFTLVARTPIAEGEVAVLEGAGMQLELLCAAGMAEEPFRIPELHADPPGHLLPLGNKFVVFEVDDLAAATAELAALDVEFLWTEKELAPGWRATAIRDCEGNLINIFQRQA